MDDALSVHEISHLLDDQCSFINVGGRFLRTSSLRPPIQSVLTLWVKLRDQHLPHRSPALLAASEGEVLRDRIYSARFSEDTEYAAT